MALKMRESGGYLPPGLSVLLALLLGMMAAACGSSDDSERCGNGEIDGAEACDDGNRQPDDGCSDVCQIESGWYCESVPSVCSTHCGDWITAGQETCDDGNLFTESCPYGMRSCDVCTSDCVRAAGTVSYCSDQTIHDTMGEECDDGNLDVCDGCLADCTLHTNSCGDGYQCGDEDCDDGNTDPCDGCLNDCTPHENICGDGFRCGDETCDDGNTVTESCPYGEHSCFVCTASCRNGLGLTDYCGDGTVDAIGSEVCDDGRENSNVPCNGCCRIDCTPQRCGDGVLDFPAHEDCDDGNTDANDGCEPDCRYTGQDFAYTVSRRWRTSWSDEFNGPVPGREACYDNALTPPQCLTLYWDVTPCPASAFDELANLDKCTWQAYYLYNWMDNGQPLGEGVNAFDPHKLLVQGGELLLYSDPSPPPGGFPAGWSASTDIDTVLASYDCGNPPQTGWTYSTVCPILSGGLQSKALEAVSGFAQTYGRFDVRARLPIGRGSWPAHWMLPQEGPWPGDGEIDIMEATSWNPESVGANFHDGVEYVNSQGRTVRTHMSSGSMNCEMSQTQQGDEYHVYSVEWDPTVLRFFVDNYEIGQVWQGTLARNTDLETGENVGYYPLDVPDEDFYILLNSTVAAAGTNHYPHPMNFPRQTHHIDYVRAFVECEEPMDYCPWGGAFDGNDCLVGPLPDRGDLEISDSSLVYPAVGGDQPCPDGGQHEDDLCVVYDIESGVDSFTADDNFFTVSPCVENTLSPFCPNPCRGIGRYDGYNCYLASAPFGQDAFMAAGRFYYDQLDDDDSPPCPIGRPSSGLCEVGEVPPGRTGFVIDERHFYVTALCDPTATMPNCPQPCPLAGEYDGNDCYVFSPPVGANPFIYNNSFYYQPLSSDPETRCPYGSFDGANCIMGVAPQGTTAIIKSSAFYVLAACGHVPRAWFHP